MSQSQEIYNDETANVNVPTDLDTVRIFRRRNIARRPEDPNAQYVAKHFDGYLEPLGGSGAQGSQGTAGSQGAQGSQGVLGPQGAQGAQGSQGSQGFAGTQGAQGFPGGGAQGSQGSQGSAGVGDVDLMGGNVTIGTQLNPRFLPYSAWTDGAMIALSEVDGAITRAPRNGTMRNFFAKTVETLLADITVAIRNVTTGNEVTYVISQITGEGENLVDTLAVTANDLLVLRFESLSPQPSILLVLTNEFV